MTLQIDVRGDFILVGDLMRCVLVDLSSAGARAVSFRAWGAHQPSSYARCGTTLRLRSACRSVSVLLYNRGADGKGALEERAHDYEMGWPTASKTLADDVFLTADAQGNLKVLRMRGEAEADEDRARLEAVGVMSLGAAVNRVHRGSLVMRPPDAELGGGPTLLMGCVSGAVVMMAPLPQQAFDVLWRVQGVMAEVPGVGNLAHGPWRRCEVRNCPAVRRPRCCVHFGRGSRRPTPRMVIRSPCQALQSCKGTAVTPPPLSSLPCCTLNAQADRRISELSGFIDGDLIEGLLDLPRERQERVAKAAGEDLATVLRLVEELSRMH